MDKESTTFRLSSKQLARLLSIGSYISEDKNQVDREQKRAELLRDWLAAKLPAEEAMAESLPTIIRRVCQELQPLASEPFGNLLQDPETSITTIRRIKDYSKKLTTAAEYEIEHDAAGAIYYAAIAGALVFHNKKITKFSYEKLSDSFSVLMKNSWLTPDLVQLFRKAHKLCQKKAKYRG
jgi:hypothetical protein